MRGTQQPVNGALPLRPLTSLRTCGCPCWVWAASALSCGDSAGQWAPERGRAAVGRAERRRAGGGGRVLDGRGLSSRVVWIAEAVLAAPHHAACGCRLTRECEFSLRRKCKERLGRRLTGGSSIRRTGEAEKARRARQAPAWLRASEACPGSVTNALARLPVSARTSKPTDLGPSTAPAARQPPSLSRTRSGLPLCHPGAT